LSKAHRLPPPASRLPSLARLESLNVRGMKLGLAAIDAVCERLDRPERRFESALVAGTNGKGSTAATLASIAQAGGLATGLYTSPHLIDSTERIRIGDADVSPEELDAALEETFAAADRAPGVPLTYFEAMTSAAFVCFARRRLDLAVLEVGLGGRYDATNVVPASLSVVTSIALDHVEELGPTIESISGEKAGIFRSGRPALVESAKVEARRVFRDTAERAGAVLHELVDEVRIDGLQITLSDSRFRLTTPVREYSLLTPLLGAHQARNAATGVRAAELLPGSRAIGEEAIARGVRSVRWPGRLERFRVRDGIVFLDGCHNPAGASALAEFLDATGLRPDLVFGAMADKDVEGMFAPLAGRARRIRIVPIGSPRAATPNEIRQRVGAARPDTQASDSVGAAIEELLGARSAETIIVAGSLYLVGEARAVLLSGRFDGAS